METCKHDDHFVLICKGTTWKPARHASILPYVHAFIAPQNIQYCVYAKYATASKVTYSLNGFHVAIA